MIGHIFTKFFKTASVLAMATWLCTSCSSISFWSSEPAQLKMTIKADANSNPNIDNEPTSVSVQIVQMNTDEIFLKAPFLELYNDANATLATSFISSKTIDSVLPATTEEVQVRLAQNTTHIGVIVGFAQYDNTNGKAVFAVEDSDDDLELELFINGVKLELKEKD